MHLPGVLKGDFLSIMCSEVIRLFSFICILLSAAICYNIFVLNYLLIGDFNSKIEDNLMCEFCEMYNLTSLIREPTCFKNVLKPSSIDLMLTNRPKQFQQSCTVETGLSDHHKMTITVLKTSFQKQSPTIIKYRDYKRFDVNLFRSQLLDRLYSFGNNITYAFFETNVTHLLRLACTLENQTH